MAEKQEFHFGLEVHQVIDIRIDAEDMAEALELFRAHAHDETVYSRTLLSSKYEVLGVHEGPLPTPPGSEHVIEGELVGSATVH